MEVTRVVVLIAGILAFPVWSAHLHLPQLERLAESSACRPKTVTVSANPTPYVSLDSATAAFTNIKTLDHLTSSSTLLRSITQTSVGSDNYSSVTQIAASIAIADTSNAAAPQTCHHDNCLREFIRFSTVLGPFCKTYTATFNPNNQGGAIPTLYNCPESAARISSACTCLDSMASPTNAPGSPSATSTSNILASSSSTSCKSTMRRITDDGTSTVSPFHDATTTLQLVTRLPTPNPSTGKGMSQVVKIPTMTPKWTNSTGFAASTKPTYLPSGTGLPLSSRSNSTVILNPISPTITSAVAMPTEMTKWVTLPVNEGIRNCYNSQYCKEARDIFESCVNIIPNFGNNTATAECLCNPENNWTSTTDACLKCTEAFFPERVDPEAPLSNLLSDWSATLQKGYCNATDQYFYRNVERFLRIGQSNTALFQSPIYLWRMSLLDEPVPYLKHYDDALYPVKKTEKWSTFPISRQTKKVFEDCLKEPVCTEAARGFDDCMKLANSTWSCFCGKLKEGASPRREPFSATGRKCADCLAQGLPARNYNTGLFAEQFPPVREGVFNGICDMNSSSQMADAKNNFVRFGGRLTQTFESPVLLFNFTLMENQLPEFVQKRDLDLDLDLVERVLGRWKN